jgi:SHS2 domain-containing protein
MSPFSLLDHTADIRLKVTGCDLEQLFNDALAGLTVIVSPHPRDSAAKPTVSFSIQASDLESLLVDFLNEALFTLQTRKVAITQVTFDSLNEFSAAGQWVVQPVAGFAADVKAATYHDLKIIRHPDGSFDTTIVFDL